MANHNLTKYNQIWKQPLWRILWNKCLWKLGTILTEACKEIQYLGKLYTTVMKLLPLKLIPVQGPLIKISNFSNNYILVHIIYWKSSMRIDREKFQKLLKTLLNGSFSNQHSKQSQKIICLWWCVVWCIYQSC